MAGVGWFRSALLAGALALGLADAAHAKRVALVLGNGAYPEAPLVNPANDAADMAARLRSLGFEVVLQTDATRQQMAAAFSGFLQRLEPGDEAVLFYAGHGVQVRGINYMLPIDIAARSEVEVEYQAFDLNKVLRALDAAGTRANLLLLDACRNNPFERRWRSAGRGLAAVEAASGTLISYAAAPGTVAADGDGRNSPYTRAWLQALGQADVQVEEILKQVHVAVRQATGARQITWQEGQIVGRMVLNRAAPAAAPVPAPPRAPAASGIDPQRIELAFWESADRSGLAADYEAYLASYPEGAFAQLARNRLARLQAPPLPAGAARASANAPASGVPAQPAPSPPPAALAAAPVPPARPPMAGETVAEGRTSDASGCTQRMINPELRFVVADGRVQLFIDNVKVGDGPVDAAGNFRDLYIQGGATHNGLTLMSGSPRAGRWAGESAENNMSRPCRGSYQAK